MSKPKPRFTTGDDVFARWRHRLETGERDPLYRVGDGDLARFEIGPGRVVLLGGAPGAGRTAFAMQVVIDGLRLNADLRAAVCNVEMGTGVLLDRQLARLSGIDLKIIRDRQIGESHADRIDKAVATLETVADRLVFLDAPFDLANVAATADETGSNLIVLDYIQRVRPPGTHSDKRGSVDLTMDFLRQFANEGTAVLVVAALSRTKDKKGRTSYDSGGLNLASFRESSELEFGADDAFILVNDPDDQARVILRHLKARHAEKADITLEFDGRLQRFTPVGGNQMEIGQQLREAWAKAGKERRA